MKTAPLLSTRFTAGPQVRTDRPVLVTITDFTSTNPLDLPGIARSGLRLRRLWPALDGAVGMWLWAMPLHRRTGSVSVWTDRDALHGFVGLAEHVAIMRRYRDRGEIRTSSWEHEHAHPGAIWHHALHQLRRG